MDIITNFITEHKIKIIISLIIILISVLSSIIIILIEKYKKVKTETKSYNGPESKMVTISLTTLWIIILLIALFKF